MSIFSFLVASTQHHIGKLRWRDYCFTFLAYWGASYLREHELPVSSNPLCHLRLVIAPTRISGTPGVTFVLPNAP
jgi:hypothetical protein